MELLFVTVIGASLATIIRYLLPSRGMYGAALLPAVGAAVTATVWVALVWAGLTFDGTWIWVASLLAGIAVALVVAIRLPRHREAADVRSFEALSRG
ncbi:hypothetical protein I6E52_12465 [Salinibacterium sp. NG253]|uniref:hypothetical protein n=1 Tax=Salinibacterium sp. NG253 TaxID=2792039 RepID=UPI0018CE3CE2|nr:hypothetical protein [Salinibacterium sp. NG253]MBH0117654.1 hypothetical protein [Salinibacterium sp. NG253]